MFHFEHPSEHTTSTHHHFHRGRITQHCLDNLTPDLLALKWLAIQKPGEKKSIQNAHAFSRERQKYTSLFKAIMGAKLYRNT